VPLAFSLYQAGGQDIMGEENWSAASLAGFQGWGVDSDLSALPFGQFSTFHLNGTNKVIDTPCIFCYASPCLPPYSLADSIRAATLLESTLVKV
jgi:hypothetical protein